MNKNLNEAVKVLLTELSKISEDKKKIEAMNEINNAISEVHPLSEQPIYNIQCVPVEKVQANDYNPNSVAEKEMALLHTSIKQDGYTQPIVAIHDPEIDKYVIIDGFHRYFTCKKQKDINEANRGMLPIVVLKKAMNERMAATVRHNRARGRHAVSGMSKMVFSMLENGWSDSEICNHLGMEVDELTRMKHITGFSKLFENVEYSRAWKNQKQIIAEKEAMVKMEAESK